jgi:HAE1 family hydrophobic/amphiphilic exporter-1
MDVLNREGARVAEMLHGIPGTIDVKLGSNPPKPELTIKLDRTRAADLGLTATDIATQLRLALDGIVPAKLREGKDETDIRVRLREGDRGSIERIEGMDLFSPRGARKLADVAVVGIQDGPSVIEHENRERQIAIYSQIAQGGALGEIAEKIRAALVKDPLPPG